MVSEQQRLQAYLEVMQICDSTFPIGTFNHSFGMENYLHMRTIKKAPDFKVWFENYYRGQFRYGEGLLVLLCYQALDKQDLAQLWAYDRTINASTVATEVRDGTRRIAKQMLILLTQLYGPSIPGLAEYREAIAQGEATGHPAIAFCLFAHYKALDAMTAFMMYGYSVGSTLLQNAVRAVPLGQRAGQVILNDLLKLLPDLYDQVCALDADYLGASVPGLELAQINHETQGARLFMS